MSGQKGNGDEARVPVSIVFISIGMIILLTVAVIWLLMPSTMPTSVYNVLRPLVPETIAIPTPASVAVVPTLTPTPETAVLLPDESAAENSQDDGLVTMAEALEQEPLTGSPVRIVIPAIDLDAPVERIGVEAVVHDGQTYYQWLVPEEYVAGWHENSARLGQPGNTVLNGHHNVNGEVFRDLVDLEEGDELIMYDENQAYTYRVTTKEILPERGQPIEVRLENAHWIAPTEDERITLITCWPYTDNSHRLVVVAEPIKTTLSR
ncbi:MAG: sortase [Anaerolineae bacterium]|nr:sortase [Anaerolineae bacterium]